MHDTDPTNPDSDTDQMTDGWEIEHSLDPKSPADKLIDTDDDGMTDDWKVSFGLDPGDPADG